MDQTIVDYLTSIQLFNTDLYVHAIKYNQLDLFNDLIRFQCPVNFNVINYAIMNGLNEFVDICIQYQFPFDAHTVWHALEYANLNLLNYIQTTDPILVSKTDTKVLHLVSSLEVFKWLHEHNYDIRNYNYEITNLEIFKFIFSIYGNIINSELILCKAIKNCDIECFNWLIENNLGFNDKTNLDLPIYYACKNPEPTIYLSGLKKIGFIDHIRKFIKDKLTQIPEKWNWNKPAIISWIYCN